MAHVDHAEEIYRLKMAELGLSSSSEDEDEASLKPSKPRASVAPTRSGRSPLSSPRGTSGSPSPRASQAARTSGRGSSPRGSSRGSNARTSGREVSPRQSKAANRATLSQDDIERLSPRFSINLDSSDCDSMIAVEEFFKGLTTNK